MYSVGRGGGADCRRSSSRNIAHCTDGGVIRSIGGIVHGNGLIVRCARVERRYGSREVELEHNGQACRNRRRLSSIDSVRPRTVLLAV